VTSCIASTSASRIAAASGQRAPGSFCSARSITAASAGGAPGARNRERWRHLGELLTSSVAPGAVERGHAREQLVPHEAERVHVAPPVEVAVAGRLLGTHVPWRAHDHPGAREPRVAARRLERARHAEVGQARPTGRPRVGLDEHVLGLEVAVHHAGGVGGGERVGQVAQHGGRLGRRQRAVCLEPVAQRAAGHVLHREPEQRPGLARGVDLHDVRVAQPGHRARLLQEAPAQHGARRELGRDDLDGHRPVERLVAAEPHATHAPAPSGRSTA
jgi:hypothetical protein